MLLLDDLLGKLTTHKFILHDDGESDVIPSKKNLTLKAKKREESSSENNESDDEEDPFTLIKRDLEGIMKCKKYFKRFKSRNDDNGKSFSNSNSKSNKLACFEYGSTEHLVKECPEKKKEYYKKNKKKQAMVSKWSDSEGNRKMKKDMLICVKWQIVTKKMN